MSVSAEKKQELIESLVKNILGYKNPYDVFEARPDDPLESIERKYKKISLQIHPDKCKHPQAVDAFNALRDALNMLKDPEYKEKRDSYAKVMEEARDKVRSLWQKAGKHRKTKEDDRAFEKECKKMTQKILQDRESSAKRAEEVKMSNERRVKEEKVKLQKEMQIEVEHEQLWEESRDERVDSWRVWQQQAAKRKAMEKETVPVTGGSASNGNTNNSAQNGTQNQTPAPGLSRNPPPPAPVQNKPPPPPPPSVPILGVEPPKKKKKYTMGPLKPPRPKGAPSMG